jgi:hypothetical protein
LKKYAASAAACLAVLALQACGAARAPVPAPTIWAPAPAETPPAPAPAETSPAPAPAETPPPPAPAPPVPPPPPNPAAPPPKLSQSAPAIAPKHRQTPAWTGGAVRAAGITVQASTPPAGYGLYVYELPGDQVAAPILDAIEQFNCADLEQTSAPGQDPSKSAIMVLPVKTAAAGPPVIDLALSHELLADTVAKPDFAQVYVVIASAPVAPQDQPSPQRPAITSIIKIGYIAPPLVESWLVRLRDQIEAGHIASPADFDLKIRSVMTVVGAAGIFIGIQSAKAAQPSAACQ